MRKFTIVAVLLASLSVSGCNTVRGFGEDLKSVADAGDELT